jgi:hypothetical protein
LRDCFFLAWGCFSKPEKRVGQGMISTPPPPGLWHKPCSSHARGHSRKLQIVRQRRGLNSGQFDADLPAQRCSGRTIGWLSSGHVGTFRMGLRLANWRRTVWLWTQCRANGAQGRFSLITGKNTGKIREKARIGPRLLLEMQYFRAFPRVLPTIDNREEKKQ